jgi:anti-anti-sigma factor
MKLELISEDGGVARVACEGTITMAQVQQGLEPVERLLGSSAFGKRVLFDLTKTTFIDSSGVSWMLICHKEFSDHGGRIIFHSAPKSVRQTLDLLRMDLVLHLAANEEAARKVALEDRP